MVLDQVSLPILDQLSHQYHHIFPMRNLHVLPLQLQVVKVFPCELLQKDLLIRCLREKIKVHDVSLGKRS